jgi:hypothetical protein
MVRPRLYFVRHYSETVTLLAQDSSQLSEAEKADLARGGIAVERACPSLSIDGKNLIAQLIDGRLLRFDTLYVALGTSLARNSRTWPVRNWTQQGVLSSTSINKRRSAACSLLATWSKGWIKLLLPPGQACQGCNGDPQSVVRLRRQSRISHQKYIHVGLDLTRC